MAALASPTCTAARAALSISSCRLVAFVSAFLARSRAVSRSFFRRLVSPLAESFWLLTSSMVDLASSSSSVKLSSSRQSPAFSLSSSLRLFRISISSLLAESICCRTSSSSLFLAATAFCSPALSRSASAPSSWSPRTRSLASASSPCKLSSASWSLFSAALASREARAASRSASNLTLLSVVSSRSLTSTRRWCFTCRSSTCSCSRCSARLKSAASASSALTCRAAASASTDSCRCSPALSASACRSSTDSLSTCTCSSVIVDWCRRMMVSISVWIEMSCLALLPTSASALARAALASSLSMVAFPWVASSSACSRLESASLVATSPSRSATARRSLSCSAA
mmetsp:Transcript_30237/g.85447  ORF Transcript_30237/g.85447 Transcript_30237/m.85447 type:complete len:343 (-) Transcript_30237:4829-5857(-)